MKFTETSRIFLPLISSLLSLQTFAISPDNILISSGEFSVISETPNSSSGLNKVYVVRNTENLTLSYKFNPSHTIKCYKFDQRGSIDAIQISDVSIEGNILKINNPESECGYIIDDDNQMFYFWLIDYSKYQFSPESISLSSKSDCNCTMLDFNGYASPIYYYGVNGRRFNLNRALKLSYTSLDLDENSASFEIRNFDRSYEYISDVISIFPPVYSSTSFTLEGDAFLNRWNEQKKVTSPIYFPISVIAETKVKQLNESEENSNQINSNSELLGGNAPCELSFEVTTSEGVIHNEWQFSSDQDFENIIYRINDKEFDYTFIDEGKTFIRYIGSNADGSCETISDVYEVAIGTSELKVPNIFSPNNDGINDEWKISYQSIIKYECWIYDRYGKEVFHTSDPNKGWSGKSNNGNIRSGVFYYIIKAQGSDGKNYNLSGDINIISSKSSSSITDSEK